MELYCDISFVYFRKSEQGVTLQLQLMSGKFVRILFSLHSTILIRQVEQQRIQVELNQAMKTGKYTKCCQKINQINCCGFVPPLSKHYGKKLSVTLLLLKAPI